MLFLIAYDGSEGALAALHAAVRLAEPSHASLLVTHILDPREAAADVVALTRAEAMATVVAGARADLEELLAREGIEAEPLVEEVRRGDDIPGTIVRLAQEREADVIVISSHRAAGVKGLVVGSVTQHVLRLAPCPVLVVRPTA